MTDKTDKPARGKSKADRSQEKASSPDKLTEAQKKGDIELSEDDLKSAVGGANTIKWYVKGG